MTDRPNTAVRAVAAALLLALVSLGGCNTVEGAGEDIQAGGRAIEKTAERTKGG